MCAYVFFGVHMYIHEKEKEDIQKAMGGKGEVIKIQKERKTD